MKFYVSVTSNWHLLSLRSFKGPQTPPFMITSKDAHFTLLLSDILSLTLLMAASLVSYRQDLQLAAALTTTPTASAAAITTVNGCFDHNDEKCPIIYRVTFHIN